MGRMRHSLVTALAGLVFAGGARAQAPQLSFEPCNPSSATQLWFFDAANSSIILASNGNCVDILEYGTTPGSEAYTAPCHHEDPDPTHHNQNFTAPALSLATAAPIVQMMSGLILDADGSLAPGSLVALNNPSGASAMYLNVQSPANNGTGTLVNVASGLCLDAAGAGSSSVIGPVHLDICSAARASFQGWSTTATPGALQQFALTPYNEALCLTVATFEAGMPGSGLVSAACPSTGTAPPSQSFVLSPLGDLPNGFLLSALAFGPKSFPWVADPGVATPVGYYAGYALSLSQNSTDSSAFVLDTTGYPAGAGTLVHAQTGLCLDGGPIPNSHGCLDPVARALPYCNADLPGGITARVADLLSRMTLAEKIALTGSGNWADSCDTKDPGVQRLDIPAHQWLVETNSMIASHCYGPRCATAFPSALNLAASFNRTVWSTKGTIMGVEMRALNNAGWHRADTQANTSIGLNGFGPDINQVRDPRNGRVGELPSEDPLLIGEYAVGMLTGMQGPQQAQGGYYVMSAGVKHYAGYSLETNRFASVGNFSQYDLWDTYLRPYEAAFTRGGAAGSMCAYVSLGYNGGPYIPACASEYLLQTVAREYFGRSDVYHTSDCGAVSSMASANHYAQNDTYAAADALNAGMDINSERTLPTQLGLAIEMGLTTEAVLDKSVTRTLTLRMRLGLMDPFERQPLTRIGPDFIGNMEHLASASDASEQGNVLVKNDGVLPLKMGLRLAVLGPLAAADEALLGDYYADEVCPTPADGPTKGDFTCVPTIAASIAAVNTGGSVVTFPGVTIKGNDSSWGAAIAAAADPTVDAVVLVLGTDTSVAGEGTDRTETALPGLQVAFGLAVAVAAGTKPVIFLLVSCFSVAFDPLVAPSNAIVLAFTPSFGAPQVAASLFGLNRWGRSPITYYPLAYASVVALGDFAMTPGPNNAGRSYRYYGGSAGAPLVRFGQGMTYTTVGLACTGGWAGIPGASAVTVSCNLTSTAGPAGDQILQVYHRASGDIIGRVGGAHPVPLLTLVDFARTPLGAGVTAPVSFTLDGPTALSLVDEKGASVLYQGLHFLDVWDGGANNVTISVQVPTEAGNRVLKQPPIAH
jgi:beta-D-xylosidase 4